MQKRSTNKEVKEKIQSHIWDCIDMEDETLNQAQILVEVVGSFKRWWQDNKQIRNQGEAFGHYLQCLPSELSFPYYYSDMEDLLEQWLGVPEKQYMNEEIAQKYYWLIFRELSALCKKHHVAFT